MDWDDTIFPTTAYNILKKQSLQDNFWDFIDSIIANSLFYPGLLQ